mmetsp:Transcript_28512/g.53047  ORF Transcript_28512/g.53047 Transcript_28512/m.53047 type:complete len:104 (+) Transcript_28512:3656-3967(+)
MEGFELLEEEEIAEYNDDDVDVELRLVLLPLEDQRDDEEEEDELEDPKAEELARYSLLLPASGWWFVVSVTLSALDVTLLLSADSDISCEVSSDRAETEWRGK